MNISEKVELSASIRLLRDFQDQQHQILYSDILVENFVEKNKRIRMKEKRRKTNNCKVLYFSSKYKKIYITHKSLLQNVSTIFSIINQNKKIWY